MKSIRYLEISLPWKTCFKSLGLFMIMNNNWHILAFFRVQRVWTCLRGRLSYTRQHNTRTRHTDNTTESSQPLRCFPPWRNGGTTKYDTTRRTRSVYDMLVSKRIDVWTVSWCSVESWRTEGLFWHKLCLGGLSLDNCRSRSLTVDHSPSRLLTVAHSRSR